MKKKKKENQLLTEITDTCISDIEDAGPLICYILQKHIDPMDSEKLYEICVTNGLVSYFAYQDSLEVLLKSGTIQEIPNGEQTLYSIADAGADIAEKFMQLSEQSYRDAIMSLFPEMSDNKNTRNQDDVNVVCEPLKHGCYLHVTLNDNSLKLLGFDIIHP